MTTRSFAVGFGRLRMMAALLCLAGAFFLVADRAGADEHEVEDTPPTITNGVLSPSYLPHEGGNVQISVDIIDDDGVHMTTAQVFGSDGTYQAIQLYQGNQDTYYGTLEVPANYSDSPLSYGVEVQAYDTNNAFASTSIGEVQVEGVPQFDEPPYVSNAQLTPQYLPSSGGTVTISTEASDNRGISSVFAQVSLPGGGSTEVPLQAVSSSLYEGSFEAPANLGPLAAEYLVEVVAQDDIGQESRLSPGTIVVEAPPQVPSTGLLEAWPNPRSFGSVSLGKESQRLVFVRNVTPGGEPVEATARLAGSLAFSLPGAPPEGIQLTLAAGEKRAFLIEFRPTSAGEQSALLQLVRGDGGQPGLSVELTGRGKARR
jgi:hypothetical protein